MSFDQNQFGSKQMSQRSMSNDRQSRTGSLNTQDPTNKEEEDQNDSELVSLMRASKSFIALPVRSLSPFRNAEANQTSDEVENGAQDNDDDRSSRSTTPEVTFGTSPSKSQDEEEEEEEEEEELGKDLFQLQFRKSLLKALSSFSELQDKSRSLTSNDADNQKVQKLTPLIEKVEVPKKVAPPAKKPKVRQQRAKRPAVDVTPPKVPKKKIRARAPVRKNMLTRSSAAKCSQNTVGHSTYYNISQSKVHIFKAAEEGDLQVVVELLPYTGPTIKNGKRNQTLLHAAAANGQSDVVMHLLNLISPNVTNKDGQTPAHLAAMNGHTQILKIMYADKEFDPDVKDLWQRTFSDMLVSPLFEASLLGNRRKVKVLLELGADPDYHAGKLVEGILSRELRVTTARQLASAVHGAYFMRVFLTEKKDFTNSLKVTFTRQQKASPRKTEISQPIPALVLA